MHFLVDLVNAAGPEAFVAILSLIFGVFTLLADIGGVRSLFSKARNKPKPYREQIEALTRKLIEASAEVDSILQDMAQVGQARESAVAQLEQQLQSLVEREKQLKETVTALENAPPSVAKYLAEIVERGEKKSAWRDYALFGAGVVVSTVMTLVLKAFGV